MDTDLKASENFPPFQLPAIRNTVNYVYSAGTEKLLVVGAVPATPEKHEFLAGGYNPPPEKECYFHLTIKEYPEPPSLSLP
ncbi:TPA: hypothetical protein RQO19_004819 [Klebsiella michiganensis]|nr:hypothetical protein [Klebsiella michiganensis]